MSLGVAGSGRGVSYKHALLYADDLMLIDASVEGLKLTLSSLERSLASKGMRVNVDKTKILTACKLPLAECRDDPCGGYRQRVDANSIKCGVSDHCCVYKRCSGMKGTLNAPAYHFVCPRCSGRPEVEIPK